MRISLVSRRSRHHDKNQKCEVIRYVLGKELFVAERAGRMKDGDLALLARSDKGSKIWGSSTIRKKAWGVLLTKLGRLMYGAKPSSMAIPERGEKRSIDKGGKKTR